MKLREYLDKHNITIEALGKKANISRRTMYNALEGHDLRLTTVIGIYDATNGKVKPQDFIDDIRQNNGLA